MGRSEIKSDIHIDAPPGKVFEILSDTVRIKDWMPNVTSAKAEGSKKGLGSERVVGLKMQNMSITSHQKVTAFEPGKKFAWSHVADTLDGKPFEMLSGVGTEFTLAPMGKGTHVNALMHFEPQGFRAKIAAPLIGKEVKSQVEKALENLKRLAEKG